ncbi:uncharacterized protein LOC115598426 [Calypte anna]|uniref:uncharacterized protein LOC115598426 n=1 Tax=Calypte anna TaxID=9244 RepID=UPI0011C406DE|nr:uncharacterized protein LOC115598426 [Calypte anna]
MNPASDIKRGFAFVPKHRPTKQFFLQHKIRFAHEKEEEHIPLYPDTRRVQSSHHVSKKIPGKGTAASRRRGLPSTQGDRHNPRLRRRLARTSRPRTRPPPSPPPLTAGPRNRGGAAPAGTARPGPRRPPPAAANLSRSRTGRYAAGKRPRTRSATPREHGAGKPKPPNTYRYRHHRRSLTSRSLRRFCYCCHRFSPSSESFTRSG